MLHFSVFISTVNYLAIRNADSRGAVVKLILNCILNCIVSTRPVTDILGY